VSIDSDCAAWQLFLLRFERHGNREQESESRWNRLLIVWTSTAANIFDAIHQEPFHDGVKTE